MLNIDSIDVYDSDKILDIDKAEKLIEDLKVTGKRVGLCHGGFDLLHPGHMKHFESAKKLCDVLFVSITSDEFVKVRKGDGRPIYTDKLRAYSAAAVCFVDYVVITDFKLGVDVINKLKPSFYIKGPDFINKTTPGIVKEREKIKEVGGEIAYTNEPPMSTTNIIKYIKDEIKDNRLLMIIDRDGTLIEDRDFFGKDNDWINDLVYNEPVISLISYLQTKYDTTKVIVTNQTGVARRFFDIKRVEEINKTIDKELLKRNIKIDSWQYCPDADKSFCLARKDIDFNPDYVKDRCKRKPNPDMVDDALLEINKKLTDFDKMIVLGDRHEDKELAINLKADFIDVKDKDYGVLFNDSKDLGL